MKHIDKFHDDLYSKKKYPSLPCQHISNGTKSFFKSYLNFLHHYKLLRDFLKDFLGSIKWLLESNHRNTKIKMNFQKHFDPL